jgi:hypothetical protein
VSGEKRRSTDFLREVHAKDLKYITNLAFSCMIFVIIVLKSTSILRLISPSFGGLSVRWSKLRNNRSINQMVKK